MLHKNTPIQKKLMAVILLTTTLALLVSGLGFITFEIITIRGNMMRALETRANIIAPNIQNSLLRREPAAANAVLSGLQKDPRMISACVFDDAGRLFGRYPATAPDDAFPRSPDEAADHFGRDFVTAVSPVLLDGRQLGTIYLKSNLSALTERYSGYAMISATILLFSLLTAFFVSKALQKQISLPILTLADTARAVSEHGDYSVRATKHGADELGLLTDTFNHMLARIQEQNRGLRQLAAIIEATDDGIISKTLDGIITSWNPGAEKLFGYRADEVMGKSVIMIIPQELVHEEAEILKRLTRGESIEHFETVRLRKDGSRLNISASISPIKDASGNVVSISKIARDITAQKRAEAQIQQLNADLEQRVIARTAELQAANRELQHSRAELKSIFESLPGLYLVLTPELEIVSVSDAYLNATMTTRAGILHRNLFDVFPDNPADKNADGVSNLRASLDRVKQNGTADTMAIQKYDVRRPDGVFEERYWSPINSPVFGADREIKYIVHRVEEVTEFMRRKGQMASNGNAALSARVQQMEAEIFQSSQKLQATNQQLEAANKELEAFSYSVSHDLRAPLRAVDGFSQAVEEDYAAQLPEEGRRYLKTIRQGAQRMGRLIDDLLTFSRLSRKPMLPQAVNMDTLVAEVWEEFGAVNDGRQIQFHRDPLPSCLGDRALLRQVWTNLLANARKYTGQRDVAEIAVGCTLQDGEPVYFIRDNGAGFDMQYADKLFGVFQRLHHAHEFEGTGVGLAIVQRIIHRHGGRIWAESAPDQGAAFYFTIQTEKTA